MLKNTKIHTVILPLSRNLMVFDREGNQIPEYQKAVTNSRLDEDIAIQIAKEAKEIYITKAEEWSHQISKGELLYLLGLGSNVRVQNMIRNGNL